MGKKRRRVIGDCREWLATGSCKFGDDCKFEHVANRDLLVQNNEQNGAEAENQPSETHGASLIPMYAPGNGPKKGVARPQSLAERTFQRFMVEEKEKQVYTLVLKHVVGLSLLMLAPCHPVLGKEVVSILFQSIRGNDLNELNVSGKFKKGSVLLKEDDVVCKVETKSGESIDICLGVSGQVIEVNKRLIEQPHLLQCQEGFLVIIKPQGLHAFPSNMVSYETYLSESSNTPIASSS